MAITSHPRVSGGGETAAHWKGTRAYPGFTVGGRPSVEPGGGDPWTPERFQKCAKIFLRKGQKYII